MKITDIFTQVIKNIWVAIVIGCGLWICLNQNPGYQWVYHALLKKNMEFIRENAGLTEEERYKTKLENSFTYLQFLKERTPEDAVILYPRKDDFFPPGEQSPYKGEIYNLTWATRFLYPRKIIFPDEMTRNIYTPEITHTAIVNGKGFDRIHNFEGETFEHGVLPVKANRQKK